jgi:hypothetical protein
MCFTAWSYKERQRRRGSDETEERAVKQVGIKSSRPTSLIMSSSSAWVGFWPRERITVPSSLVVMVPLPSLSKREKASLNSVGCQQFSVQEELKPDQEQGGSV